jgi:hypothetical protein
VSDGEVAATIRGISDSDQRGVLGRRSSAARRGHLRLAGGANCGLPGAPVGTVVAGHDVGCVACLAGDLDDREIVGDQGPETRSSAQDVCSPEQGARPTC